MKRLRSVQELEAWRESLRSERATVDRWLIVSSGTCGQANGSRDVIRALREELGRAGTNGRVGLRVTGCLGFCEEEPLLVIRPEGLFYPRVSPEQIPEIVAAALGEAAAEPIEKWLYRDPVTGELIAHLADVPFYKHQKPVLSGTISSLTRDRSRTISSRAATRLLLRPFRTCRRRRLSRPSPSPGSGDAVAPVFPPVTSGNRCRRPTTSNYVICNADEGDPGAYANRGALGGQSPQRARGHDHRRIRHGRHGKATCTCGMSIPWP